VLRSIKSALTSLPKPLFFGLLGAIGCALGWLLGEPILLTIRPSEEQIASGEASAVMVFNPEFTQRLKREGAKSGDIQISLIWNNINDLDLHCVDPRGEEIYFGNKRSRSRGVLDVDMNVSPPRSNEPVENIYWPSGRAPSGKYMISVHHYENHGAPDPSQFKVALKAGDSVQEFTGQTSLGDPIVLVHEFTFESEVASIIEAEGSLLPVVVIGVWTSLLATGLAAALMAGQNLLLRKALLHKRQILPLLGGGLLAGLLAGSISQCVFSSLASYPFLIGFGRVLGWILLGGILGFGMSYVIPNLPRRNGLFAGAAGGFAGAIAFLIAVPILPDFLARLLGSAILGAAIGLMIAWAEKLAREASLIVHWGPNERTVINLGERPVVLGSSNEAELYLPKEKGFPPISALVTFRGGRIEMQNKMTNTNHELKSGNKLQLGDLLVEVQTDSGI
jgi:hypothetical protein